MCLIFIMIGQCPEYPLIIAANRDEYHSRPSLAAHFWPNSDLLAGKDLLAGGSWLGVTKQGRFAAVTNYRKPIQEISGKSRGQIVTGFLESRLNAKEYAVLLENSRGDYAGYSCVFGSLSTHQHALYYFSNQDNNTISIENGIHGLSNALLNTSWPKVDQGKAKIRLLLQKPFNQEDWMNLLADTRHAIDSMLPDTGISIEKERLLSPAFILGETYGTRCSTLVTLSNNGILHLVERSYSPMNNLRGPQTSEFSFKLEN